MARQTNKGEKRNQVKTLGRREEPTQTARQEKLFNLNYIKLFFQIFPSSPFHSQYSGQSQNGKHL